MTALLPELLQALAALFAAAAVATASWGSYQLVLVFRRRYLAHAGGLVPADVPQAGLRRPLQLLRKTVVAFLSPLNERWLPPHWVTRLDAAIQRAGDPSELKATELVGFVELCAAAFLAAGIALAAWLELGFSAWIVSALFGASYPAIWLRDRIRVRQQQITRALPYNLDLLTLSVEAGLDFAAALAKVVEKGRPGPLRDELSVTVKELKLGKTREEALRNLASRVEMASLTTFVSSLVQADRMGTPLGKTLRILSTQLRVERTHRAEKLANEAPVKLLLPLIGFIFPTIFLMLFGPIAYQVFYGGSF